MLESVHTNARIADLFDCSQNSKLCDVGELESVNARRLRFFGTRIAQSLTQEVDFENIDVDEAFLQCEFFGDAALLTQFANYCRELEDRLDEEDYDVDILREYHARAWENLTSEVQGGLRYGIEIESISCESMNLAYKYNDVAGHYGTCEEDSTVDLEFITRPDGLEVHLKELKLLETYDFDGVLCVDSKKAGLHIHATRSAISELAQAKLLLFVNKPENAYFLEQVAERPPTDYCQKDDEIRDLTDACKVVQDDGADKGKYFQIAVRDGTIEFRMFKSPVKNERPDFAKVAEKLKFVDKLIAFCEASDELTVEAFESFVTKLEEA
jgi:hypothetical protein